MLAMMRVKACSEVKGEIKAVLAINTSSECCDALSSDHLRLVQHSSSIQLADCGSELTFSNVQDGRHAVGVEARCWLGYRRAVGQAIAKLVKLAGSLRHDQSQKSSEVQAQALIQHFTAFAKRASLFSRIGLLLDRRHGQPSKLPKHCQ